MVCFGNVDGGSISPRKSPGQTASYLLGSLLDSRVKGALELSHKAILRRGISTFNEGGWTQDAWRCADSSYH